jgi:hypothetical protein
MIGPESKIHLFDTALALRYTGSEQPTLYAVLGGPSYCENGYHFFGSTPHLGQQVRAGEHYVYPPLCEWENDPGWRHPEWCKIEQGMRGERLELPVLWAEFLERA